MRRAIELAAAVDPKQTDPNPRVGCVIVLDGEIIAEGAHQQDGGPHAEVAAFHALGERKVVSATLYVTLEPCSTPGRTGACTDVIIRSGMIQRVVFGDLDPNPAHRGHAEEVLAAAGIEVESNCLQKLCSDLNPEFYRRMQNIDSRIKPA